MLGCTIPVRRPNRDIMQRIRDEFLEKLGKRISLHEKEILEIGCGSGAYTARIASQCRFVTGIDPDSFAIQQAWEKQIAHAKFQVGGAEQLNFSDHSFDIVIFTLSFHHILATQMKQALDEALRVVKKNGYIVFLEPAEQGSFFDAEILFDTCDGDERAEKRRAQEMIHSYAHFTVMSEFEDETIFYFNSDDDFISSMAPKKNLDDIKTFLNDRNHTLSAMRRISICEPIV